MNLVNYYNNSKHEMNLLLNRLELLKEYEKYIINEQEQIKHLIKINKGKANNIKSHLKSLQGIEYELYSEIVIKGLNVSKAVEKVAEKNEKDISTIWKNYYPNVKKYITK